MRALDAIVITAAIGEIPPPLLEQLKVGGKLVMPAGSPGEVQLLMVIDKVTPDKTTMRAVTAVRFVPFIRPQ